MGERRVRRRSQAGDLDRGAWIEGFTLIDMIATLAVAGLLVMLALPYAPRATSSTGLRALVAQTVALLKDARSTAILQDRPFAAVFDARRRTISFGARSLDLPRDLNVSVVSGETCGKDGARVEIFLRGDGANCGAILRFANGADILRVRVNRLTGYDEIVKDD